MGCCSPGCVSTQTSQRKTRESIRTGLPFLTLSHTEERYNAQVVMEMMELKEIDTARAMLRQTQVLHFRDGQMRI